MTIFDPYKQPAPGVTTAGEIGVGTHNVGSAPVVSTLGGAGIDVPGMVQQSPGASNVSGILVALAAFVRWSALLLPLWLLVYSGLSWGLCETEGQGTWCADTSVAPRIGLVLVGMFIGGLVGGTIGRSQARRKNAMASMLVLGATAVLLLIGLAWVSGAADFTFP